MAARNPTVLSFSTLATFLLAVGLVLVNVVVSRASTRIDLTEERLFSIGEGTEKILANLKDPAKIRVFWGGLQAVHEPVRRHFAALLDEMADASDGRVTVRWVDVSDKAGKEEAEAAKVPEFEFISKVGDEQRASKGYCSLVVESGAGEPQGIHALVNRASEFEYLVATALVRATRRGDKVLALIDGSERGGGMMGMGGRSRFEALKQDFKDEYGDSVQWWHSLDQPIPDNVAVALVLAPRNLKDTQVFHLEQFLLRGGKAVVCVDPLDLENVLLKPYGEGEPSGLEAWLEALGVTIGRGTAMEGDRRLWLLYLVSRGPQRFDRKKSGYWFRVLRENLDLSNPAMRYVPNFSTYWPAPFSFDASKQAAAGRKVSVLASTSPEGMRTDDMSAVREGDVPTGAPREKVPLALLVEGPADSMWKGKPKPGEPPPPDPHGAPISIPGNEPEKPGEPARVPAPDAPKEPAPDAPKEPAPKEPAPPAEPQGPKGPEGEPPAPGPAGPGDPAKPDAPKDEPAKAEEPQPADAKPDEKPADPKPAEEKPAEEKPAEPPVPPSPPHLQSGHVRLVLVGDADMLTDQLGQPGSAADAFGLGRGGTVMVGNTVEWLMGDDALLSLRAKDAKARAVERPEAGTLTLLQTLNLGGIPILAAFAGLVVFLRRRSQR